MPYSNKDKKRAYQKEWRKKNKDKTTAKNKKAYEKRRIRTYSSDEEFLKSLVSNKRNRKNPNDHRKVFNLTYEQVLDVYNKYDCKCFYSGQKFIIEKYHPMSMSIDRIDNNKGYTIDNIVLCSRAINLMKNKYPYSDLIPIFKAAIKNYKKT